MASANGFALVVTSHGGETFELTASWAAPFFTLVNTCDRERPLLYHAESLQDAERFASMASSGKPHILQHDFTPYKTTNGHMGASE